MSATTVGNYALFGGGNDSGGYPTGAVDVYDSSLTRTIAQDMETPRNDLAATTVGNYALFGGGYQDAGSSCTISVYTIA